MRRNRHGTLEGVVESKHRPLWHTLVPLISWRLRCVGVLPTIRWFVLWARMVIPLRYLNDRAAGTCCLFGPFCSVSGNSFYPFYACKAHGSKVDSCEKESRRHGYITLRCYVWGSRGDSQALSSTIHLFFLKAQASYLDGVSVKTMFRPKCPCRCFIVRSDGCGL